MQCFQPFFSAELRANVGNKNVSVLPIEYIGCDEPGDQHCLSLLRGPWKRLLDTSGLFITSLSPGL